MRHYNWLTFLMFFSQVAVLFTGSFYYKSFPKHIRLFSWLIFIATIQMLLLLILGLLNLRNLWLSHISTIFEFCILSLVFYHWIEKNTIKHSIIILLIVFVIFWITSKFTFESFTRVDGWTAGIAKIIQISLSALLLLELIKDDKAIWTKDSRFWIATGILIFSAGSLFMVALFNEMLQISRDRLKLIWNAHWSLIILSNILYIKGFLCSK